MWGGLERIEINNMAMLHVYCLFSMLIGCGKQLTDFVDYNLQIIYLSKAPYWVALTISNSLESISSALKQTKQIKYFSLLYLAILI